MPRGVGCNVRGRHRGRGGAGGSSRRSGDVGSGGGGGGVFVMWTYFVAMAMIQFIVQHDDTPSIYRDMYEPGQFGFHHSAVLVDDFEAEFARFEALGFVCATRLHANDVDAAYFDTRAVTGGFTEIHGTPPHILDAFATWRRSHAERRPGDPSIVPRVR